MELTFLAKQDDGSASSEQFASDVLTGLCASPKSLSAKYFYDDRGSQLFQQITRHPDYYPTRTEFSILESIRGDLPVYINGDCIDVIELGAGDGHKSRLLIEGFLRAGKQVNFFPIDISAQALDLLAENFIVHPNLHIHGVVADYFEGLRYVREHSKHQVLVLFLGSNIGNFDRNQSLQFLQQLWLALKAEDLAFIGFDLKKDIARLTRAYNDSDGLTRDFNLNLLRRINRELNADFKLEQFSHHGYYNPSLGAMESYLVSMQQQNVEIAALGRSFTFEAFEPLHLEYSFKYSISDIEYMAEHTGFALEKIFCDPKAYFCDALWRVEKALA